MNERNLRRSALIGYRFRLESPIGKGGMAEVWRARDIESNHCVAVKFLRPTEELIDSVDTRFRTDELDVVYARFEREAKLLSTINHRAIPKLVHHGDHLGTPYLAMEYINGTNLREYLLTASPLPLDYAVAIATEVADALECAHQKPVVHRDLKPQNILISVEGAVFLLDFGIALPLTSGTTRYTLHGGTLGSPGYQAPEQIREDPVEPRTDTYALGCVVFEMITGRMPFRAGDVRGLAGQHLDTAPPSLSEYVPHIHPDLDNLVLQMLAKHPHQRPDMAQVRGVMARFLPSPGAAPVPAPRPEPDPTVRFRFPDGDPSLPAEPDPSRPGPSPMWLKRSDIRDLCTRAEHELDAGLPADALHSLAAVAEAVRKQWGPHRAEARRARLLAAEGLRLEGECGRAEELYTQIAHDLAADRTSEAAMTATLCRLRAAECGLAFGRSEPALTALVEGHAAIACLSGGLAAPIREAWSELVTYLRELRYGPEVEKVLDELTD
ncbi:serine/threonine-protein kinase [Nocardia sp. NPDC101769]|uniref:serine/threonine-protein kinase n=1 Tax=Nocardia sp. NPDC101769 TaxID=3364333 RepID=UPI0037FCA577